jgi:very-short-patch-repair endonuclease
MRIGGRAAALRQFLSAIRNIGRGTGIRATRYRGDAQKAMAKCMEAVPCWIMPTWRVSESLPPTLGAFDLVIIDEASQSDIMALPALLRGGKVLVVGDDRQVSPSAVGLEEKKLKQLRHGYLQGQPFSDLLMPGTSFYELAQAVFPSSSIMLNEHFRCVEPIIRFSLQFYPEKFVPLRIPKPSERLDPPLVDVYIENAKRKGMVNEAEAIAIVDEVERLVNDPAYDERTIGVIALLGNKQSKLIQDRLLERIGEDKFQKHKITCGDPPTFQGKERDIIFLSMVAVPRNAAAQLSRQFQQRYNVALSRARDRMYLYRSVAETDLQNENDLKQKVISHFQAPMPAMAEQMTELSKLCDSDFEREVLRRLVELDYRVTPQVAVGEYRIDLVVDGGDDRRLAIELDGDKYHGPDRWFEDYARQKTLERMNWIFWRCWGSSFARDPEGCMADLIDTLEKQGIKPIGRSEGVQPFTERRVLDANQILGSKKGNETVDADASDDFADARLAAGDSITIVFDDEPNRLYQLLLVEGESDLSIGQVSIHDETGKQLRDSQTDDEFELIWSGKKRLCVVRSIKKAESVAVS